MQVSLIGVLVAAALLILARRSSSPLLVAMIASFAFGATAIVTLPSLGGSSPLLFTAFAGLLLLSTLRRRHLGRDLGGILTAYHTPSVVLFLAVYAVTGAMLFPRLFAAQTGAFVPSRSTGLVYEVPLEPTAGNITQTGYFVVGALTFFAVCVVLGRRENIDAIRRGFFAWCTLHVAFGLADLLGKVSGAGDILKPIRSATYAMVTNVEEAGFVRIAGAHAEASAFAAASLACLCFTFTYWRRTQSKAALLLSLILGILLLLSTSTTAYVGGAILTIPVVFAIARSALVGRISRQDILVLLALAIGVTIVLAVSVYDARILDPFVQLFERTVVNKASSASGQERAYWNAKSLQSLVDTVGLGVGFGSSRASSWIIAVLSQAGIIGALLMAALLTVLFAGVRGLGSRADPELSAVSASVSASALGSLVALSISGGSADPGLPVFIALAVVLACRQHVRAEQEELILARATGEAFATSR